MERGINIIGVRPMKECSSASQYHVFRFGKSVTKAYLDTCTHANGESECTVLDNVALLDELQNTHNPFVDRLLAL